MPPPNAARSLPRAASASYSLTCSGVATLDVPSTLACTTNTGTMYNLGVFAIPYASDTEQRFTAAAMPWWGNKDLALTWANAIGDRAPSGNVGSTLGAMVAFSPNTWSVDVYCYAKASSAVISQSVSASNWYTYLRAKIGEGRSLDRCAGICALAKMGEEGRFASAASS